MGEISFCANYNEWIAVKKMSIDAGVPNYEVVAMLASVRETIDRKAFQLGGVDTAKIDAKVAELAKGRRKAYGTISEVLSSLNPGELKALFASAVPEEKLAPLAEAYFFKSLLTALGFYFEVTVETMKKIYPDLKMPMPKGRIAGAKKKE